MGDKLQLLKEKGVITPDAADGLQQSVVDKIEALTDEEIKTIIKFKLEISGTQPWEPDADGSIL